MARIILLLALAFCFTTHIAMGTSQKPDILLYYGDTLALLANPLSPYLESLPPNSPSPIKGCIHTACSRGYVAVWALENDSLFLVNINSCCNKEEYFFSFANMYILEKSLPHAVYDKLKTAVGYVDSVGMGRYIPMPHYLLDEELGKVFNEEDKQYIERIKRESLISKPPIDIEALFPGRIRNGRVFANWYTGTLIVPAGKLLNEAFYEYESVYETERLTEVVNGRAVRQYDITNEWHATPDDFGALHGPDYKMSVPKSLVKAGSPLQVPNDTVFVLDSLTKLSVHISSGINARPIPYERRQQYINSTLDATATTLPTVKFSELTSGNNRYGRYGYKLGQDEESKNHVAVFAQTNRSRHIFITIQSDYHKEFFQQVVEDIFNSIRLFEASRNE